MVPGNIYGILYVVRDYQGYLLPGTRVFDRIPDTRVFNRIPGTWYVYVVIETKTNYINHTNRGKVLKNSSRDKKQGAYRSGGRVRACYVTPDIRCPLSLVSSTATAKKQLLL